MFLLSSPTSDLCGRAGFPKPFCGDPDPSCSPRQRMWQLGDCARQLRAGADPPSPRMYTGGGGVPASRPEGERCEAPHVCPSSLESRGRGLARAAGGPSCWLALWQQQSPGRVCVWPGSVGKALWPLPCPEPLPQPRVAPGSPSHGSPWTSCGCGQSNLWPVAPFSPRLPHTFPAGGLDSPGDL